VLKKEIDTVDLITVETQNIIFNTQKIKILYMLVVFENKKQIVSLYKKKKKKKKKTYIYIYHSSNMTITLSYFLF